MGAPTQLSEGQLHFKRGEHVIVSDCIGMSQRDGQKWFFGEHTGLFFIWNFSKYFYKETGEKGIFPEDLVVRMVDGEELDSTIWV